jgi:hypothetical protein
MLFDKKSLSPILFQVFQNELADYAQTLLSVRCKKIDTCVIATEASLNKKANPLRLQSQLRQGIF